MQIRLMGSPDLVKRMAALLGEPDARTYPNRGGGAVRAYLDIDDRVAERLLDRADAGEPLALTEQEGGK